MKDVLSVILAGGKGARLEPLTRDRAKPAVPFGGIYRIIDFTLSNSLNSGIRKNLIFTQYKAMSLDRHINLGWQGYLCRELGEFIDIVPPQQRIDEHWYQGTADAVYQNIYTIEKERPAYVVDPGRRPHLQDGLHEAGRAAHRDAGRPDDRRPAGRTPRRPGSSASCRSTRRAAWSGFEEKPEQPKPMPGDPDHALASMGIYVFTARFLFEQLCLDATRHGSKHDFGRDMIPSVIQTHRVFAYPFLDENRKKDAYWRDVGTLDAYYEANMDLVSVDPQLNLYDHRWPIRTYQPNLPPPKFVFAERGPAARRGQALDSIVCQGSIISGGQVERSIVGTNAADQQLRPGGRFDPVRRRQRRPARQDPPGDHRQGGGHPGGNRDRLRPRTGPLPRLHHHRPRASR